MFALRRLLLVVMVLTLPALLTWISYLAATSLLAGTSRYMAPQGRPITGCLEFAALFFITVLETRARWTVWPSN